MKRGRSVAGQLAIGLAITAGSATGQIPEIEDSVDVHVVNVDVVVTDSHGQPIHGLTAADFELLADGGSVPIDYFSAIADGLATAAREAGAEADEPTDQATAPADKPLLAVVFDARDLLPAQLKTAVGNLRTALDVLLPETRGAMIAQHGRNVRVETTFTTDRELLEAALARLEKARAPSITRGGRQLLIRRIEAGDRPLANSVEQVVTAFDRAEDTAISLLSEIRALQQVERFNAMNAIQQLKSLVRSLSGLPGRKTVLYVGQGLRTRPAEVLYRLWWEKYSGLAPRLGVRSIEAEIFSTELTNNLVDLVQEANVHRIAFYSHDPAGLRVAGGSMLFDSSEANTLLGDELIEQGRTLLTLAEGTGGVGGINGRKFDNVVDAMVSGFRNYYSLGFTPEPGREGRIEVRLKRPGARLRYLDRYRSTTPAQRLNETAMAALLTDVADNPLEASVEVGKSERQKDGTWIVSMMVKVPIARLTLLPRESSHVGRLSVVVLARDDSGKMSAPAGGEVPIEIPNAELLMALSSVAGCRLQVQMRDGEQKLAIALRDDVARTESTLNLMIAPGRGG